ncbi:secreted protein C-like [Amphibalanus amphitrite]|uniref:secreted protein C-like n=1 Tax=Amphibalanus amphitrite TaxID=1232801 RepID=UPI001C90461F|nr:secreted protein C-like [Amphibalanus amphitrite]
MFLRSPSALLVSVCFCQILIGVTLAQVKRQANSGSSYPTYTSVPKTSFSCDQFGPGYYADLETDCQAFHVCHTDKVDSFICPPGTVFNQKVFVCDWWYNVDCGASDQFYSLNSLIGRESEAGGRSSTASQSQRRRTQPVTNSLDEKREENDNQEAGKIRPVTSSRDQTSSSAENLSNENLLSFGDGDVPKQGVTDRADTFSDDGGEFGEKFAVTSGEQVTSSQGPAVLDVDSLGSNNDEDREETSVSPTPSSGRKGGISRWGRLLGNAIAKESRGARPTASSLPRNRPSVRPVNKESSGASRNSIKPTTATKNKTPLRTQQPTQDGSFDSERFGSPKKVISPTRRPSARPSVARAPLGKAPSATRRPFQPTVPRPTPLEGDTGGSTDSDSDDSGKVRGGDIGGRGRGSASRSRGNSNGGSSSSSSTSSSNSSGSSDKSRNSGSSGDNSGVGPGGRLFSTSSGSGSGGGDSTGSSSSGGGGGGSGGNGSNGSSGFNRGGGLSFTATSSSSGSSGGQTPQPQYQFDRVRAQLATLLEGVEPLDVPANQLDPQPASAAPGRVVFSARGQDQPEWLYALGGLVL